jgi:UDP-4-amino-4,6-dideoxy-N-acetyl-beta-L-altrosamine N-acetyltransferase
MQNIRKMSEEDLDYVLEWRNHPDVRNNMYTQHVITPEEHYSWFTKIKDSKDCLYFIFEREGKPSGVIYFTNLQCKTQTFWGFYSGDLSQRGVGREMEALAVNFAFNNLNLPKLNCEVLGSNMKVVNFHRKHGFKIEGVFKNHFIDSNGEPQDIIRLAITPNEWERAKQNKTIISIGDKYDTKVTISDEKILKFAESTGDFNPIHFDPSAAKDAGFQSAISHGILPLGIISKVLGTEFPGKGTIYLKQSVDFILPIYNNSEISVKLKVISAHGRRLTILTEVFNENSEKVISGEAEVLAPKNE